MANLDGVLLAAGREPTMRRSFALVCLFGIGCGNASQPDTDAAREFVRTFYSNVETVLDGDPEPEYAAIPSIPTKRAGSASCGVRVKFLWRDGSRTTHDDWVIWVTSDHKAIDWSSNVDGDNWRQYVRSVAEKSTRGE
jgi:hypothetical protein